MPVPAHHTAQLPSSFALRISSCHYSRRRSVGLYSTPSFSPLLVTCLLFYLAILVFTAGCTPVSSPDLSSLTFLIESTPTNLDPRYATDAQSLRIDGLLFSSLLERDAQMNLRGDLAESWDIPDALTYVFHLRRGIRFHDSRPVTSADVKATFDFIMNP